MAEASSRRAQSWGAFSKAGAAVHSSSASVSNLTELMHKGRNIVKVMLFLVPNVPVRCAPYLSAALVSLHDACCIITITELVSMSSVLPML